MDPISAFVEDHKLGLGRGVKTFVEWLTDNFYAQFRAFSDSLGWAIEGVIWLLSVVPPIALIALVAGLAWWLHRSIGLVALVVAGLLLILNLG